MSLAGDNRLLDGLFLLDKVIVRLIPLHGIFAWTR